MTRQTYTTGALRPAISRREAFRTIGLGAAFGLAGAGAVYAAVPITSDPCLDFFRELDVIDRKMEAVRTVQEEAVVLPRVKEMMAQVYRGDVPAATTADGAAAALRYAIKCEHLEQHELSLVQTALAFLEGGRH